MKQSVKAVIPPELDIEAMTKVLEREFAKYAPFLVKDFDRTTKNWKGAKPVFTPVKLVFNDREFVLSVRVLGPEQGRKKWHWLNEGTEPHVIRAKNAKTLRFRTGYQAGSKPGTLFTITASSSGPFVSPKQVNHPGNAPRNWSQLIVHEHQRTFTEWMNAAMRNAAHASGHEVKK